MAFGIPTLVLRLRAPHKLGKLEAIKRRFGKRAGSAIHVTAYKTVPIAAWAVLLAAYLLR